MKFPHNLDPFNTKHLFQFLDKPRARGAARRACAAADTGGMVALRPGALQTPRPRDPEEMRLKALASSILSHVRQLAFGAASLVL